MLKCKVCGTANDSHATVCLSCGASLIEKEKKNSSTGNTENEIFSSKNSEQGNFSDSSNEIYSSKSSYNEAQQRKLFEKIRRQEEAIGDVFDAEPPKKSEPVVINGQPTHGENRTQGTGHSPKKNKIPQRIIESVDKQVLQQKMKPTTKPSSDIADDDEKVELTSSGVIERIQEKHEQTMQLRKLQAEKQRQKKLADSQSAKAQQIKKQKKSQAKLSESNTVGKDKQKSTSEAVQPGSAPNKTVSKPMLKTELTENSTPVKKLSKSVQNTSTADDVSKTKKKILKQTVKSVSDGNSVKKKPVASTSVQSAESITAKRNIAPDENAVKSDRTSADGKTVKKRTVASTSVQSAESITAKRNIAPDKNAVKPDRTSADGKTVKKRTVASTSVQSAESITARRNIAPDKNAVKPDRTSADGKTVKKRTVASTSVQSAESITAKRNIAPDKNTVKPDRTSADGKAVKKKSSPVQTSVKTVASQSKVADRKAVQTISSKTNTVSKQNNSKKKTKTAEEPNKVQATMPASRIINKDRKHHKTESRNTAGNSAFANEDIENNRYFAALAYIGILCFVTLYKGKRSDYCKAHAKQGIVLFILSLFLYMITLAIVLGLRILLLWTLKLPYIIYTASLLVIATLMLLGVYIPTLNGVIAALDGEVKMIPVVGKLVK